MAPESKVELIQFWILRKVDGESVDGESVDGVGFRPIKLMNPKGVGFRPRSPEVRLSLGEEYLPPNFSSSNFSRQILD